MKRLRPLRADDPAHIGGHQLLGRLGAGGMGVVYLGRTPGGALVALKAVRAEYADDPGFLARFRREAAATSALADDWLVPVLDSDVDAAPPWLATAYVPGLSLGEAVAEHGPLPERTVRVLGARLAAALTAVHGAGLVHRDVKPGNVLLALDGPRLIDFGIVRPGGATAITTTGLVVGTPGFLSPEQAQAHSGEVGPAGDVFALGCVLAYTSTGRLPFGAGATDAASALYHTVHSEPELTGVPEGLLDLVRTCLQKQPGARPPAQELAAELARGERAEAAESAGAAPPLGSSSGPGPVPYGWLPERVLWTIAERSSAVLAVTEPLRDERSDAVVPGVVPPADPPGGPSGPPSDRTGTDDGPAGPHHDRLPSRTGTARPARRFSRRAVLGFGAAAVAAGGGVVAWRAGRTGGADGAALPRRVIALQADLSGDRRALGRAQERGARLAVRDFNRSDDRPFDLRLQVRDDRGDADRAGEAVRYAIGNPQVIAVLGPTGNAGLPMVAARCGKADLSLVTVSSTVSGMATDLQRYPTYFQLRADRDTLAAGFREYLTSAEPAKHTALVDDRAATDDKEWRIVENLEQFPPAGGRTSTHRVPGDSTDFTAVANAVGKSGAGAVVYAGTSPRRAARFAAALDRTGFDGIRTAGEQVLYPDASGSLPFLEGASKAAEGWLCIATYADPARLPAAKRFARAYRSTYPDAPAPGAAAPFAVEAYDAVRLIAAAAGRGGDGNPERAETAARLRGARHNGLAKPLGFAADTGYFEWEPGVFAYRVTSSGTRFLGAVRELGKQGAD